MTHIPGYEVNYIKSCYPIDHAWSLVEKTTMNHNWHLGLSLKALKMMTFDYTDNWALSLHNYSLFV